MVSRLSAVLVAVIVVVVVVDLYSESCVASTGAQDRTCIAVLSFSVFHNYHCDTQL